MAADSEVMEGKSASATLHSVSHCSSAIQSAEGGSGSGVATGVCVDDGAIAIETNFRVVVQARTQRWRAPTELSYGRDFVTEGARTYDLACD